MSLRELPVGASIEDKLAFVVSVNAQLRSRDPDGGVGDCPGREGELGHIWRFHVEDADRGCRFCGQKGRGEGGFLEEFGRVRAEVYGAMHKPASVKGGPGKPKAGD